MLSKDIILSTKGFVLLPQDTFVWLFLSFNVDFT